jgi:steroid delta-isomerase-like uncharacterized protein
MSIMDNKAIVRRYFHEAWNEGRPEVLDELLADDFVNHGVFGGQPPDREGAKLILRSFRAAFPDLRFTIEDMVAEEDKVVTRWTASGTHLGDLIGIAPTGRRITVTGIVINRIAGGRMVEHWSNRDDLGMMQQLGVIHGIE